MWLIVCLDAGVMCNWCCVFWARQSCLPGNEESFQLYPSNLPFNPEITPKKFCFVSFIPEVWWHSSIFSQPTGCFNESLRHLKAKVRFFLRQRTSCMFVAICNKGFLKVNCGSRSSLALFSGKALMSEEIRASKGNMSSALLREREREKNDGAQWEQTKHELNQCAEPESASAAAVRFTFMGFRSAEVLSWPPALILIRFQSLQTPCIWSLFHKTRLKHCWTTKVPRLMCTVKNKSSAFTLMWLSLGGNISWLTLCEEGHCCTVTLAKHPIKSRDNSKKSGIKRD